MTNFDNNEINSINSISLTLNDLSHNCLKFLKNRLNINNNDFNNYILNNKLCKLNNSKSLIFTFANINLSEKLTPKTKVINTENYENSLNDSNKNITIPDNNTEHNEEESKLNEIDKDLHLIKEKKIQKSLIDIKDLDNLFLQKDEDDQIKSDFTDKDLEYFKSLCLYNYGKGYVLVPPYKHPFIGKKWWMEIDFNFDKSYKLNDIQEKYGGWWNTNKLSFKNCWFFKESYLDRLKELDVRFFIDPSYKPVSKPKICNNENSISLNSLKKIYSNLKNNVYKSNEIQSNEIQSNEIQSNEEPEKKNVENIKVNKINKLECINEHFKNNKNILTIHSNYLDFNQNIKNIDKYNFGFLIEFLNNDLFKDKKCIILSYNSELYYGLFNESLNKYYFPISDINNDFFKFLSKKKLSSIN